MEDRLDRVTKQNEELSRELQELRALNRDQSQPFPPVPTERRPNVGQGGGSVGGNGSSCSISSSLGGGLASGGGDPTTTGRAQVVGNRQLGKLSLAGGWHLNRFLKVYFDWEHAIFDNLVFFNTGRFQKSNDVHWLRLQAYF
jgi:hypothetical protein